MTLPVIISTILVACMGLAVAMIRMRAAARPVTAKKIILPPLFMSTGALMFLFPVFRVPWWEVWSSLGVGVIFSSLLILTSNFEVRDEAIFLKPSKAFAVILVGLVFVRVLLKVAIGQTIEIGTMGGVFFLLAFGMIVSWRIAMFWKYKRLERRMQVS
ncbi:CcdC family protein [Terribacillus sp. DMT04]|uniref:CcdC family protein n=1 Tax=Terribacillus sp. DMT04 TaxID=2850441 RepID=UPI001C2BFE1B|nr:cytochrome c biogenesis protein CcdC [Terribacillus sp. DMT04]QXE03202.1 cytochrome c biogenesis protein CcdC [Terribacillus sp. DMT04]